MWGRLIAHAEGDGVPTVAPGDETEAEAEGRPVESQEKMRKPRVGARPVLPTRAVIAEHYPLHLNYRRWCEHFRAGKARLALHLREPIDHEKLGVTVSSDYAFMGSEEADEKMQPSLVILDDDKEAFWAICTRTKTGTEHFAKDLKDILHQSGYEGERP